jgi:hypothetical protein
MKQFRQAAAALLLAASLIHPDRGLAQAAPSPEALQAANELFALMSKDMIDQITAQAVSQAWPAVSRALAGKVDQSTLAQLRTEFERIQQEQMNELLTKAPAIYARYFSTAELHELVAFYRAPLGQKLLRETPKMFGEVLNMVLADMAAITKKGEEAFEKVLRERGYIK